MRRYTVTLQLTGSALAFDNIKDEVERVLFRLHPRITYKMGQIYQAPGGTLLAQFMVDGKHQLLLDAFSRHDWALPVRFDGLSWGWLHDDEEASSIISGTKAFEVDPLRAVAPLAGQGEYTLIKGLLRGKYLTLMISTLALLLILIANAVYPKVPWLMVLYALAFAVFMFTLSDTPLDLRVYGQRLSFRPEGLEIKHWLLPKPTFLAWDNIWGLNYSNPVCELMGTHSKLRFLLSEQYGCQEQAMLLKTMVARAGLLYVEGNFRKLSYRKPDAI